MTNGATFELSFMLIHEWPLFFGVALVADLVIAVSPAQLVGKETTMRVVAVAALEQPFVDPMVKRASELRANLQMAAVAQPWCSLFQQEFFFFRVMRVVAIGAGYSAFQMGRPAIIVVLCAVLVAIQAARADLRGRSIFKCKDLGLVPAAVHVSFPWAVARLATLPFGPRVGIELARHGCGNMRCVFEALG